jgi:hypothetical protein
MPSRSNKQARFMAMVAHNPEKVRKKDRPSKAVAQEFVAADKASGRLSKAAKESNRGTSA